MTNTNTNTKENPRYPYTYAADYLRMAVEPGDHGSTLSRSDASAIRQAICKALGLNDEEVAKKLADYFMLHEAELTEFHVKRITARLSCKPET